MNHKYNKVVLTFVAIIGWGSFLLCQEQPSTHPFPLTPHPFPFTPGDQVTLLHGSHVDFKGSVLLNAQPDTAVKYVIELRFNKKRYGQFVSTLLPLQPPSSGAEVMNMTWPVKITGPKRATVAVRIVSIPSIATYETTEEDTVHHYQVACDPNCWRLVRLVERLFERCQ